MLHRIGAGARLSQAIIANGFVFLSGQATDDPGLDIVGQTRSILARIDALLAEAGTDKTRIVRANIALADIGLAPAMNAVWDEWAAPGAAPTRTCVEARISTKPYLIEIDAIALCAAFALADAKR